MSIYIISMLGKLDGPDDLGNIRTIGFFCDRGTAITTVCSNKTHIDENIYEYALIERVREGLHNSSGVIPDGEILLFRRKPNTNTYERAVAPEWLKNHPGIAIL